VKDNIVETAIGAAVILIAGLFFAFAYSSSGVGKTQGGFHVKATFDNVEGINVGSDVRMAGIKIGTVSAQSLDPENWQAVLTFSIDPSVKLAEDTTAKVTSEGLLGSKFIALDAGGSETILADGGIIIYTQGAVDIWKLIAEAMFGQAKGKGTDAAAPATPATP
jgi:phospholipid/cholesterol/gamma-HCH transport system substrate-binding protein